LYLHCAVKSEPILWNIHLILCNSVGGFILQGFVHLEPFCSFGFASGFLFPILQYSTKD